MSVVYWLDKTLYLNITNRCTNDCYFCLRKFKTGVAGFDLRLEKEPSSSTVIRELKNALFQKSWAEIAFCGFGEPTVRLGTLLEVSGWIRKKTLNPLRVDTNGHMILLYPERDVVKELKKAGISRLSVSLNAHNRVAYNNICRPKFENAFDKVLEFIVRARDGGLDVEITAVAIPEVDISKVNKIASEIEVGFRARPYHPCVW